MTDYDELARFRQKSGNTGFKLRPVEEPVAAEGRTGNWRLLEEIAGQGVNPPAVHPAPGEALLTHGKQQAWPREDAVREDRLREDALRQAALRQESAEAQNAVFSLGFSDNETAVQQRRAQLAGLFRRPEPTPGPAPSTSAPTLLKPLLRRIAARHV